MKSLDILLFSTLLELTSLATWDCIFEKEELLLYLREPKELFPGSFCRIGKGSWLFLSVGLSSSCHFHGFTRELSAFLSHSSLSAFHPVFAGEIYATASNTDLEFQEHGYLYKYVESSGELAKRPSTYHLVVWGYRCTWHGSLVTF